MPSDFIYRLRSLSLQQIFIVFAAFLVYVLADGTTFSFGLYVDELINEYSRVQVNIVSRISTLAALTQSVPLLLSPFVCWWTTKFGASSASFIGCIFSAVGYILPYLIQFNRTIWIPAISYGCLLSFGLAFSYVPAYLTLPYHFKDDLGLATGLAVSGSGVGQVLLAILVKACINQYGWRGASLVTGGLFLFMFVAVITFRQPASSNPSAPVATAEQPENSNASPTNTETVEFLSSIEEQVTPHRARGMTLAQILPHFISPVPIRSRVTLPTIEKANRRYSLNIQPRHHTISVEPSMVQSGTIKAFQRSRANTIAIPLRPVSDSLLSDAAIPKLLHLPQLAPIASIENSDESREQSVSLTVVLPPEEINKPGESQQEKHWLLNKRYILFCFSNFTLCLVMGVPYVIIPTYITETFLDQNYLASWTLSNVGFASACGQIILGYLHDRKIFSAWIMYTFAVTLSGVSLVILALFRYKMIVLICSFVYGLAISANYALQVIIIIDALTIDYMANAFGVLQFCQGVSTLIGIPILGLLRDLSHTYELSFLTSGFIIVISGVSMFLWPCLKPKIRK